MQTNSVVGGWVWQIIKLIQAFMSVLVTCKNEEDPFKNEEARVVTKDLPLYVYADFLCCSRAINSSLRLVLLEIQTHPSYFTSTVLVT